MCQDGDFNGAAQLAHSIQIRGIEIVEHFLQAARAPLLRMTRLVVLAVAAQRPSEGIALRDESVGWL
jgi:hypothetical protein